MKTSSRQRILGFWSAAALSAVLAASLTGWGGLAALDRLYSDAWHRLAGVRAEPRHVVIAALDDATLDAYRDQPISFFGPILAQGVARLRELGATAMGLDMLFAVSAESWLDRLGVAAPEGQGYDQRFREELARGDVVLGTLASFAANGTARTLLPVRDFYYALPRPREQRTGLTNLLADPDGAVRRFYPTLLGDGRLTLATLLAARSLGLDPTAPVLHFPGQNLAVRAESRPIPYLGPPGTFPRVSFLRLLAPEPDPALADLVRGKAVIVAFEMTGSQDTHPTPYSRSLLGVAPQPMSGPEIHANLAEALLTGRRLSAAAPGWAAVLAAVLALAYALPARRLSPARGWLLLAGGLAATLGLSWLAFLQDLLLPVAGAQAGLALGQLGVLGQRLTGEERRRRHIQAALGRYMSDAVATRLAESLELPNLGGEAATVTVLFSDIRNFTTLSERLAPEEVVEMLNAYFGRVVERILAAGGTVDKFIGDAVMAVFGLPSPAEDDALRALRAALGLIAEAAAFRDWMDERFPGRDLPRFAVGVGVHTGQVVAGNIGSARRMEYTAIGDAVNVASRLEGLCKDLGWTIVASQEALSAAGPAVQVRGRAERQVKGRAEPVRVGEVVGIQGDENA